MEIKNLIWSLLSMPSTPISRGRMQAASVGRGCRFVPLAYQKNTVTGYADTEDRPRAHPTTHRASPCSLDFEARTGGALIYLRLPVSWVAHGRFQSGWGVELISDLTIFSVLYPHVTSPRPVPRIQWNKPPWHNYEQNFEKKLKEKSLTKRFHKIWTRIFWHR